MKAGLAAGHGEEKTVMIDATNLNTHRTATSMCVKKGGGSRPIAAVVEDVDYPIYVADWWGEVHVAVHKGLGLASAVENCRVPFGEIAPSGLLGKVSCGTLNL